MLLGEEAAACCIPVCLWLSHHSVLALPTGIQPPITVSPGQPRGCGNGHHSQIHQQPFLPGNPEAMVIGCVARQSQAQPSPFSLAKAGLATSLPVPSQLPLLHMCIHPPMQLPCSAAAVQAGMWCQCHLVAGAPGLSSPPTASHGCPPAIAGAPTASLCHGWRWEAGGKEGSCGLG